MESSNENAPDQMAIDFMPKSREENRARPPDCNKKRNLAAQIMEFAGREQSNDASAAASL